MVSAREPQALLCENRLLLQQLTRTTKEKSLILIFRLTTHLLPSQAQHLSAIYQPAEQALLPLVTESSGVGDQWAEPTHFLVEQTALAHEILCFGLQ